MGTTGTQSTLQKDEETGGCEKKGCKKYVRMVHGIMQPRPFQRVPCARSMSRRHPRQRVVGGMQLTAMGRCFGTWCRFARGKDPWSGETISQCRHACTRVTYLGHAEVGEDEASQTCRTPDEEDFDLQTGATRLSVDQVGG